MNGIEALMAVPSSEKAANIAVASTAGEMVKRLEVIFNLYMAKLGACEEIGMALTSFGVSHTIHVERVVAIGPNLILISGSENGAAVELVQHTSQLNFLLAPVPTESPDGVPRRRIGFGRE